MIVSHRHRFVFLHNPKVGGTSVRATIEHLHDDETGFWGSDPDRPDVLLDRAHMGLDEIARYYPDLWERMRHYRLFCLYRDSVDRFFSSLAEYSKLHGKTDTRFAGPAERKAALLALVEALKRFGTAEALMGAYEFRHFRPQWIYWHAEEHSSLDMTALPVTRLGDLFEAIALRSGVSLKQQTRNRGDQLDLPGPLARLAASRSVKQALGTLPGTGALKSLLRRRYAGTATPQARYALSDAEFRDFEDFIFRFYARDLALWPAEESMSKISS